MNAFIMLHASKNLEFAGNQLDEGRHAQLLGMAYVLRHHGPIGDQGSWNEPELDYSFSRGRFQAPRVQIQPSDAATQYRQAETQDTVRLTPHKVSESNLRRAFARGILSSS